MPRKSFFTRVKEIKARRLNHIINGGEKETNDHNYRDKIHNQDQVFTSSVRRHSFFSMVLPKRRHTIACTRNVQTSWHNHLREGRNLECHTAVPANCKKETNCHHHWDKIHKHQDQIFTSTVRNHPFFSEKKRRRTISYKQNVQI
mmetsp:Transcript_33717/g.50310  ORF Transcript_33717/g.50310 Transcript_33717/m.50310 type:complete len:145 (-) Transcript_33717:290-724(-)